MRLYNILKKPIVTEKSSGLEMTQSCYVFEVDSSATKIDVKKAVSVIYGVEVASVNMVTTREKLKFGKKGIQLRKREAKKAYVTLKDKKAKIDFAIIK